MTHTHTRALELQADCSRCVGLCCVALRLSASADFAIDKAAGTPCPHLQGDYRCDIHAELRQRGFPGCTVYDCFGAGQRIAQHTFAGQSWRDAPATAEAMFAAFGRLRDIHELLWYLREALRLEAAQSLRDGLQQAFDELSALSAASAEVVIATDVNALRGQVNPLLRRASELARRGTGGKNYANADLIGARMTGAKLRGANLRGTQLIAADLQGADLRLADLTAADLRNTDLRGADLTTALFVRQAQMDAASGDSRTRLPPRVRRPHHWPG